MTRLWPPRATPSLTPVTTPVSPQPGTLTTYTFKVTYLQKPSIWCIIEIAENQTLDDLHQAILNSVHLELDRLYTFFMSGRAWDQITKYASPESEDSPSAADVTIRDLVYG